MRKALLCRSQQLLLGNRIFSFAVSKARFNEVALAAVIWGPSCDKAFLEQVKIKRPNIGVVWRWRMRL